MPLLLGSNDGWLPYDILHLIFHEYSLISSGVDIIRLEALLLMCKAWHYMALDHSALWCHFEITVRPENASYWQHHVPLQLSRCPPTTLFDIALGAVYPYRISTTGREKILSIVSGFVGEGGCITRRWQSLHLDNLPRESWPLFCVPTPRLVDLKVVAYRVQRMSLPETPMLQRFKTKNSSVPYPNLQNVTDLTIWTESSEEFDQRAVSEVQKLFKLRILCEGFGARLNRTFPKLEYLHLDEVGSKYFLLAFSAPHLKTLSLAFTGPDSYTSAGKFLSN